MATKTVTLSQAAKLLGKSDRQIRYMLQKGELKAFRSGKRWLIRREDLPQTTPEPGAAADQARLVDAAERPQRRRYSVTDLRAFQHARPIYESLHQHLGADHPTTERMRSVLDHLARGCHAFAAEQKTQHYNDARAETASTVVDLLLLTPHPEAQTLAAHAEALEQVVLPIIGGLMRTADRGRRSSRFQSFGGRSFPGGAS